MSSQIGSLHSDITQPADESNQGCVDSEDMDSVLDTESDEDEGQDEVTEAAESKPPATAGDRVDAVLRLLPVHAAPTVGGKSKSGTTLKVERRPGRPRKVERMPTTSDLEYHLQMSQEKQNFIDSDPVVIAATKGKIEAGQLLRLIRTEIAKEAAALQFQRIEMEKVGKETSQTSTRRIDALTRIANIELEIRKLGPAAIDPRSEEFQKIFMMWATIVRDVTAEILTPEQVDLFFNRLDAKMEGWEDRVVDACR